MSEWENQVIAKQSLPNDSIVEDLEKGLKQVYKREPMSKERYMILYHETYHYCTRSDSRFDEHPEKCPSAKVALHEQIIKLLKDHLQIIREVRYLKNPQARIEETLRNFYAKYKLEFFLTKIRVYF